MADDLQGELGRLETTLAGADVPNPGVIAELSNVRRELAARGSEPRPELRLGDVRVASPCKERWDDMVGDARVRVCNGCDRPVFNLSEMTRDEAEAVLATRGVTPCVRFYRRGDGTVMTADCPTGARRSRRLAVVAAGTTLMSSAPAIADPAPTVEEPAPTHPEPLVRDPEIIEVTMGEMVEPAPKRPTLEWSTWVRGGYGIASRAPGADANAIARSVMPPLVESVPIGELALGADLSFGLSRHGNVRIGAWVERRTSSGTVFGGELLVAGTRSLPHGGIVFRVGGNADAFTTALGFGYTDTDPALSHHATGARLVMSMTRSERELFATVGLELDPIGVMSRLVRLARGR